MMRRWWPGRDRRGNVAMMMGLLAPGLVAMAGLAVDFGNATWAHSKLDGAADAAALLATTVASNQYQAGVANPTAAAIPAATARFNAMIGITPPQYGFAPNVTISPVSISMTQTGSQFTSTVSYTGAYQTFLGGIVGVKQIALGGTSQASVSSNPYVDIQVLMDVSSSMTIAATQADINNMQTLTQNYQLPPNKPGNVHQGEACAFACHWTTANNDFLALARQNNVQLRIDVLSAAVGNLVNTIASLDTNSAFRLGLSTFAQQFNQIYPMSSNINGASSALSLIAPDINDCSSNCPETYFDNAMASLGQVTPASGNGSTQASSQKFLFIVGDGLVDQYTGSNRVIGPINAASCNALKANGITILTLYTPYVPLLNNSFYVQNVEPYQPQPYSPSTDQIEQAMAACATTPKLAFIASDASQIDAQLQVMLATVVATSGHLTM